MLFFLPITYCVFVALVSRNRQRSALAWLIFSSLVFYAYWNPFFIIPLLISMAVNFAAGDYIADTNRQIHKRRNALIFSSTANLLTIFHFKYYNFIATNLSSLFDVNIPAHEKFLPLAISFYTFTQIAYLVDCYRNGENERDPLRYGFFVLFFPHLIAGPIVHYREIIPQVKDGFVRPAWGTHTLVALFVFSVGLFKKLIIADTLSTDVDAAFYNLSTGVNLTFGEAWMSTLGYSLQIYFDFSGYSDMAIGLSLLFGVRLPINFFSPYKAVNIIEFWRRWHITLSRFLRDYLYIPLGGNRRGAFRRHINIMATMLLGGLWHGAGWPFVLWGAVHGLYLVLNHGWIGLRKRIGFISNGGLLGIAVARTLTFTAIVLAWGIFRSDSLDSAVRLLRSLLLFNGLSLPRFLAPHLEHLGGGFLRFDGAFNNGVISYHLTMTIFIIGGILIVNFLPNPYELLTDHPPTCDRAPKTIRNGRTVQLAWRPSVAWAVWCSLMFAVAVPAMSTVKQFIYFQF